MSVITVGNFDGVHIGHRNLLKIVCEAAKNSGSKSIVVTFDRHPKSVLSKENIKVITDNKTKERLILSLGIDEVVFLDFEKFSSMSGESFLKYLKEKFGLDTFVAGADFRFGKDAKCDTEFLKTQSDILNFGLKIIPFEEKEKISSSHIRFLINKGYVDKAAEFLGYRYFIAADICGGKHLGRKMGFPTVNMLPLNNIILPKFGVYATDIKIEDEIYPAISNVGVRPTFENTDEANIETYILNKKVDVQGRSADVFFKKFIRPEKKFSSAEELYSQIASDCIEAEKIV